MNVQIKCLNCGANSNVEVDSVEDAEKLTCDLCHSKVAVIQELGRVQISPVTVFKPETLELKFSVEEIQQFPALKNGKFTLPKNIKLRPHNPECQQKNCWCILEGETPCCLKLVHGKPTVIGGIEVKEVLEVVHCPYEKGDSVEETEGFTVQEWS